MPATITPKQSVRQMPRAASASSAANLKWVDVIAVAAAALLGACMATPPATGGFAACEDGATKPCTCEDSSKSSQTCVGGEFEACACSAVADAAGKDAGRLADAAPNDSAAPVDSASVPDQSAPPDATPPDAVTAGPCESDKDCKAGGKICDPLTKLCVACLTDSECGPSQHCFGLTCQTYVGCSNSLGCKAAKGQDGKDQAICDQKIGECTACLSAADCPASHDCKAKQCVSFKTCQNSTDCGKDQVCNKSTNRCVQCLADNDCGANHLCEDGLCQAFVPCSSDKQCTPLGLLCDGSKGKCAQCLQNGDCPAIYNCQSVGVAKTGLCVLDVCAQGQGACSNNGNVTCNPIGNGYGSPVACPGQTTCVAPGGKPVCKAWACQPGVNCLGDKAVECSGDGLEIVKSTDCAATSQKCVSGSCKSLVCAPNSPYCEGNAVKQCAADGLSGAAVETCGASDFCDAGACKPQVCSPGQPACDGNVIKTCTANGSGFAAGAGQDCGSQKCVQGVCKSLVCAPALAFCTGQELKACAADGLSATTTKMCGAAEFCSDDGKGGAACKPQVCAPGKAACDGNKATTCNASGSGFSGSSADCAATGKTCGAGVCVAQACGNGVPEGTEQCDDGNKADGDACSSGCVLGLCGALSIKPPGYVSVPDSAKLTLTGKDFTVETWLKLNSPLLTGAQILGHNEGGGVTNKWMLVYGKPAQSLDKLALTFHVNPGDAWLLTMPYEFPVSQWVHVAVVRKGDKWTLFVNGQAAKTETNAIALPDPAAPLKLGLAEGGGSDAWPGEIRQVRLSSTAQYTTNFVPASSLASDSATLALWKLQDGGGLKAKDSGPNGLHGDLVGSASWTKDSCEVCPAGQPICLGSIAGSCNAPGTGLVSGADCKAQGKTCFLGECKVPVCAPSLAYCDGQAVKACAANGLSATTTKTCSNAEFCADDGKGAAGCKPQVCASGKAACDGSKATTCNGNGSGYTGAAVDCAATGKTCGAGVCFAQTCGNAVVEGSEGCDDGNTADGDTCSSTCALAACGSLSVTPPGYVSVPDSAQFDLGAKDFTIETWLKVKGPVKSSGAEILGHDEGAGSKPKWVLAYVYGLGPKTLGFMVGAAGTPIVKAAYDFPADKWVHIAVSRKGNAWTLFADGKVLAAVTNAVVVNEVAAPFRLGWAESSSENHWPGELRHVRLSSSARYATEFVPALDHASDAATLALWKLQDGKGLKAMDSGPNGLHGDLVGPVSWSGGACAVCAANQLSCLGNWAGTCNGQGTGLVEGADCKAQAKVCSVGKCVVDSFASCKAVLSANAAAADGLFAIDPDGPGPVAPAKLFCDMKNGGLTLVGNVFDTLGDDAPNSTDYVAGGWQQNGSGTWATAATTVDRVSDGTGSAAVSLAFVAALGKGGQKNLKVCFVHKDGYDTGCRSSADGSLTLTAVGTGNPKLTVYAGDKLAYTFGRLAGLAGSVDGYFYKDFMMPDTNGNYCIPRTPDPSGTKYQFGSDSAGLCERPDVDQHGGVWVGFGDGSAYRPSAVDSAELGWGYVSGKDPSPAATGFRLYVGP